MKRCWCGNTTFTEYSKDYWVCNECHTLITKEDISYDPDHVQDNKDFYGKDYWEVKMVDAAHVKDLSGVVDLYLKERSVYWLKTLFRYLLPGKGSIAEVGCGLGQFSYLLKQSGYQQIAYEISPQICSYIRKTYAINVECGSFREKKDSYEAIAAFDLLEHLTDPGEFLKEVSSSLKKNGFLIIQMPCYDETLTYDQMREEKSRFVAQLKRKEHVYLYSKYAVKRILGQYGINHIVFLDALFGNDYDMFFVASKGHINENSEKEIDEALYSLGQGRLLKALINLWEEVREDIFSRKKLEELQIKNSTQIDQLTQWVKESEKDRNARMQQIEVLTKQLKSSESDREARMRQIEDLTKRLKTCDEDREARYKQIEELQQRLKDSDVDRLLRYEQIEKLTQKLKFCEEDRAKRLKQIEELTLSLKESDEDRSLRYEQIEELTHQLKDSDEDRTNRLKQIEALTQWVHERDARISEYETLFYEKESKITEYEITIEENEKRLVEQEDLSKNLSEQLMSKQKDIIDLESRVESLINESIWDKLSREWKSRCNLKRKK